MEHRSLGRAGLKVPSLCLGAMTVGETTDGFMKGVASPDKEAARVLDTCIERGVNFIDTADVYGNGRSEELLGQLLEGRRDKVLLATKCRFTMGPTPNDVGLSRKHILQACEASLKRLKTDYLDLYQVHMQDRSVPIEETLRALDDLVTQGKVRYVGCSNYAGYRLVESLWAADRRATTRYESVQLQWNLACRDAEREVIPACRTFGVGVLVWSPLARGFLTGKYKRGEAPPAGTRLAEWKDTWAKVATEQAWTVIDVVRKVAERRSTTPAAVSLRWLLDRPEVSSVIIGARTIAQLEDNLACLTVKLTDEDRVDLDKASKPDWGYPYDFIGGREVW